MTTRKIERKSKEQKELKEKLNKNHELHENHKVISRLNILCDAIRENESIIIRR